MGSPLKVEFLNTFRPRYQRNNKHNKAKNLRCFPECTRNGHKESGFCGQQLNTRVLNVVLPDGNYEVRAFGEFLPCGDVPVFRKGDTISESDAMAKCRTREAPLQPWLRGDVGPGENEQYEIAFNRHLLGWHYAWRSTKHTCSAQHSFRAYVFVIETRTSEMVFIGGGSSPEFVVFSRRRMGKTLAEEQESFRTPQPPKKRQKITEETASPAPVHVELPQSLTLAKGKPFQALADLAKDARSLNEMALSSEMMENQTLDRLMHFTFQFGSGLSTEASPRGRTGNDSISEGFGILHASSSSSSSSSSSARTSDMHDSFKDIMLDVGEILLAAADVPTPTDEQLKNIAELPSADLQSGVEGLRKVLLEASTMRGNRRAVSQFIRTIDALSEKALIFSRQHGLFGEIVKKYSSPDGLKKLKEQIERDRDTALEWTLQREYSTFDEKGRIEDVETSLFGEIRQAFRSVMKESLKALGKSIELFHEPMELAAAAGIVTPDPFYPPTPKVATFLHLQLHGNLETFSENEYSSRVGRFPDEKARNAFAKDLIIVKRGAFRRTFCNRIIADMRHKQAKGRSAMEKPISHDFDINGTWICSDPHMEKDPESAKRMSKVFGSVAGENFGEMFTRIFSSMFGKLEIAITEESLTLTGQQILMAQPRVNVSLKGIPQKFSPAAPVPIGFLENPFQQEKTCCGWLSTEEDGRACVNIVIGGSLFGTSEKSRLFLDKTPGDSNEVADFLRKRTRPQDSPHLRVDKRFVISKNRQQFDMIDNIYFFAREEDAPSMDDLDSLKQLRYRQSDETFIRALTRQANFLRSFLDEDDTEMILDLL